MGRERCHVAPPRGAPAADAPRRSRSGPTRPTEDPRAVYRIAVDDSPVKGPADALVTIVESSDFECPFCKRVGPTLKQVEETYRGKVRFVFKHNPLPFHARALPAAIATEEARAQGGDAKFWAMHDALFARGLARRGRHPPGREGARAGRREDEGRARVGPPQGADRARPEARPGARRDAGRRPSS